MFCTVKGTLNGLLHYNISTSLRRPPSGLRTSLFFSPSLNILLKIAFTQPDDFHKIWVYPEEFSEKWKPHPQCKELHIFFFTLFLGTSSMQRTPYIFFYSIPRHIVNFYNLPATLNNPFKCNQFSLLLCSFLGHGRIDRYLVWIIILPWPCNRC